VVKSASQLTSVSQGQFLVLLVNLDWRVDFRCVVESWHVVGGQSVMHDGISYNLILGRGHETSKV